MKRLLVLLLLFTCSLSADFLKDEKAQALSENKLILVTIESPRCRYCILMRKEIFDVKEKMDKINKMYIHLYVDVNDPRLPQDLRVRATPANAIIAPNEGMIDGYQGYMNADDFIDTLSAVYKNEFKGK